MHHFRKGGLAKALQCFVKKLDQHLVGGVAFRQLQVYGGGDIAGNTGVHNKGVEMIVGGSGDQIQAVCGLAHIHTGALNMHLHLGLVDGDAALGRLTGLVFGAALVGYANALHTGTDLRILGNGLAADIVIFTLERNIYFCIQCAILLELLKNFVSNFTLYAVQNRERCLVFKGEIIQAQGVLCRQGGGIPVDHIVQNSLLHGGHIHIIGKGCIRFQCELAFNAVIGSSNGNHCIAGGVFFAAAPGNTDGPGAFTEQVPSGKGIVQRLVRGKLIQGGSVELYRNIFKIQCGNGGFNHSLINGLGGGSKIIALLLIKHHADRVRAFFQVELHRLTAAHFEVFCDGNRGQSLAAGINDVNAPCAFADGRVGERNRFVAFAARQRNPCLTNANSRASGSRCVILNAHIFCTEIRRFHNGIKNGGFNVFVIHSQVIVVNQLDAGGFLQRVFGGGAIGQRDRGIFKKAVIFLAAAPGNTDLLLSQANGRVGGERSYFFAFQRNPFHANATNSAGDGRCVILHSYIGCGKPGRGGRCNHGTENGGLGGGNVGLCIFPINHGHRGIRNQLDGGNLFAAGDLNIGFRFKAGVIGISVPGNTDFMLSQANGRVGGERSYFFAFQRNPFHANATNSAGDGRCVILHSYIGCGKPGRGGSCNHGAENGAF